eukprot:3690713-Amphidinium_carterae.1
MEAAEQRTHCMSYNQEVADDKAVVDFGMSARVSEVLTRQSAVQHLACLGPTHPNTLRFLWPKAMM